jgi:homeobox-leucine zipper protein
MEKQRKEAFELQTLNVILAAMNKLLTEENDRLQKEVSQLVNENEFMRQQVNTVSLSLFIFIHYYIFFCELIIVIV